MSEDIDIVLNSEIIDFTFSKDLFNKSNNQKNKLVEELNNRALEFYKNKLLKVITRVANCLAALFSFIKENYVI